MPKKEEKKGGSSCSIAAFDMFGSPVAFNINGDEEYKTVIGCFWSLVMIGTLFGAFYIYFKNFLDPTNVEVTTELSIQDQYPKIDFGKVGFFFSVTATKEKRLVRLEDISNIISIEALQIVQESKVVNGERSQPTMREPTFIRFKPCKSGGKEASVGGQTLEGKSSLATSDLAWCSFIDSSKGETMFVEGNEDSDLFAYVRLKILPCDDTEPSCLFFYLKPPSDAEGGTYQQCQNFKNDVALQATQFSDIYYGPDDECDCILDGSQGTTNWKSRCDATVKKIREYINEQISKSIFTFNYVEAAVKPENKDRPFSYSMKSSIKIYGSILSKKIVNLYFREIQIKTDKGFLQESFTVEDSVSFDFLLTDFLDRGEGKSALELRPGGEEMSVPDSFIEFTLYSSNNQITFTRKYMKIVDVFADVGGVSEVIGFFIIFAYAWYNGIKMEQKLLNYGVLNKSKQDEDEESHLKGQKLGHISEKWEESRHFSFMELLKFGLIEKGFFCFRKDKKYDLYQQTKETFEKRTDVINIMRTIADVDTIKEAVLKEYQIRLMPYLSNQKDDDDSNLLRMSVEEAISKLDLDEKKKNPIVDAMDEYLKVHLPREMLTGNMDTLNLKINGHRNEVFPMSLEMKDAQMDGRVSTPVENKRLTVLRKKGAKRNSGLGLLGSKLG